MDAKDIACAGDTTECLVDIFCRAISVLVASRLPPCRLETGTGIKATLTTESMQAFDTADRLDGIRIATVA